MLLDAGPQTSGWNLYLPPVPVVRYEPYPSLLLDSKTAAAGSGIHSLFKIHLHLEPERETRRKLVCLFLRRPQWFLAFDLYVYPISNDI